MKEVFQHAEEIYTLATIATIIAPAMLGMAFSRSSRREILERDNYQCVVCGATDHLEAAHINHKRDKNYDQPWNGRTLCTADHLQDHIDREGKNGLSRKHNRWAIKSLLQRVKYQANGNGHR